MQAFNKKTITIISLVFVLVSVLVGLLGIRGVIVENVAWKSFYTCCVMLCTVLIILSMGSVSSRSDGSTLSLFGSVVKSIALLGVFALAIVATLSIWNVLSSDVQWKAYSSIAVIFVGITVASFIEKKYLNDELPKDSLPK